ncbi:MAG: MBL fold metallo-hydrolase [Saprospiraceae bacterium]|nr:MBL fold metallo-hydrolase [Saprospiraceae bacterium]
MKIQFKHNGITVFESSLYRTTTTIIELGESILIIDPNWLPIEIEYLQNYITLNYNDHQKYLLFTHSDFDHILGYGAFPGAKVIASVAFVKNENKNEILDQILEFDRKYYISRNYPIVYPATDIVIEKDYYSYSIENFECIFFNAPGHSKDGLFMIIPEKNLWVAGDYLSNIEIPLIDDNFESYTTTLKKAMEIFTEFSDVHILIQGHGDITKERAEIQQRIENDTSYLKMLKKYSLNPNQIDLIELEKFVLKYANNTELLDANKNNIRQLK